MDNMQQYEYLSSVDSFSLMKEIWRISALDNVRGNFYTKELAAAEKENRVQIAIRYDKEHIPVGENRIRELIEGDEPRTHSEHITAGFDRALRTIQREYPRLDFDDRGILSIHRILFSDMLCEKGMYASGLENSMETLIEKYANQDRDPLNVIPSIMEDFAKLSPFKDGNKRMTSLLSTLLLLKAGYKAPMYISLSTEKPLLEALYDSYRELDRRYPLVNSRKMKKRDRILHIIETSGEPLSKRKICTYIPDVSIRTADVVLYRLMEEKKISKIGTFKDAKYTLVA